MIAEIPKADIKALADVKHASLCIVSDGVFGNPARYAGVYVPNMVHAREQFEFLEAKNRHPVIYLRTSTGWTRIETEAKEKSS